LIANPSASLPWQGLAQGNSVAFDKSTDQWYNACEFDVWCDIQPKPMEELAMEFINRVVNALLHLHPWHGLIVHFPIALTSVALLFILLAFWRRSELLEQFAFFNIALAALGTAVAGLAGIRDFFVRFGGAAPYVNIKIFLGVSLLLLTAVIAVSRRRNPNLLWNPSTMVLYVAAFVCSFLLVSVLGFLGGAILYGF
jgi:uncharacterized membrane protein